MGQFAAHKTGQFDLFAQLTRKPASQPQAKQAKQEAESKRMKESLSLSRLEHLQGATLVP